MTAAAIISARAAQILAALRCPRCSRERHLDRHGHPVGKCRYCQFDYPQRERMPCQR